MCRCQFVPHLSGDACAGCLSSPVDLVGSVPAAGMENRAVGEGGSPLYIRTGNPFTDRLGSYGHQDMGDGLTSWPLSHCENKKGKTDAVFAGDILGSKWLCDYGTKRLQDSQTGKVLREDLERSCFIHVGGRSMVQTGKVIHL